VIGIDASAVLEFLLQTSTGVRVEARLFRNEEEFHAPHLVDVEVIQGLRRLVRMVLLSKRSRISLTSILIVTPTWIF
jgi:predicted nucleic acid-binding protein